MQLDYEKQPTLDFGIRVGKPLEDVLPALGPARVGRNEEAGAKANGQPVERRAS